MPHYLTSIFLFVDKWQTNIVSSQHVNKSDQTEVVPELRETICGLSQSITRTNTTEKVA
jgi:hypothetical protein